VLNDIRFRVYNIIYNTIEDLKKSSSDEPLTREHPWGMEIQVCSNEFPRGLNFYIAIYKEMLMKNSCTKWDNI